MVLNLLSVTHGGILLLASTDNMSSEVELLAVVWEVRDSVLYNKSSSPLLSSYPDIDSGGDGTINEEAFGSQGVGLTCGLVVTLGLPLGTLATLGITALPSSSSSESVTPSSTVPPVCLILPCRGNKKFLWRTLVFASCNSLYWIGRDTRGRLAYHLIFPTLPSVLDFMPAFPGSLFHQDQISHI